MKQPKMLKLIKNKQPILTTWQILLVTILVLGLFFRFANIDGKVYWSDETFTSLRVSGYTAEAYTNKIVAGDELGIKEFQKYQRLNSEKNLPDLVNGLAVEEPQNPPLYFMMVRFWVQLFGESAAITRSFSAAISLLSLPCIYWLCHELFGLPLAGAIAMALLASSPLHVLYAQEARPHSLWTLTILLSGAALLRAIRLGTKLNWSIYAVAIALSLYTYMFSALVAIGHGIYVVVNSGFRFTKTVRNYLIASLGGILLFSPWIFAIVRSVSNTQETTSWTNLKVSLILLIRTWLLNLSRCFIDLDYNFLTRNYLMYLAIPAVAILVGYSIYFLVKSAPAKVWLFILTLMGVTAIALILPDLIVGGRRSSVVRYVMPCYLGIQLAIAYLFAAKISKSIQIWQQRLWRIVMVALISGGIVSCAVSSQAQTWWNKYNSYHIPDVARIINQSERPLVLWSGVPPLDLTYLLNPNVKLQPVMRQTIDLPDGERVQKHSLKPISEGFSDIFAFGHNDPNSHLVQEFLEQQQYKLKEVHRSKRWIEPVYETKLVLWSVSKQK